MCVWRFRKNTRPRRRKKEAQDLLSQARTLPLSNQPNPFQQITQTSSHKMALQTIIGHGTKKTTTANSTLQTGNANSTMQTSNANLNAEKQAQYKLMTPTQASGFKRSQTSHGHFLITHILLVLLSMICTINYGQKSTGQTPAWQFHWKDEETHVAMGQYHKSRDPQRKANIYGSAHQEVKDDRQLQGCQDTAGGSSGGCGCLGFWIGFLRFLLVFLWS